MSKTRSEYTAWLKENVMEITFTKADGSTRVMKCTLKYDLLPNTEESQNKRKISENIETVRAFDLDKNEWRSFRVDSVKSYKFL